MGENEKKELQPWEAKLIGRKDRFDGTLQYWAKKTFADFLPQENANKLTDMLLDYFNKGVMNVDVKKYEVFGKKIERPWSLGAGAFYSTVGQVLGSDFLKKQVRNLVEYNVYDPKKPRYYSGPAIAAEIFVPTLMQKGNRPSCHFEEYHLAQFYNQTGIVLDEAAMISDMMQVTCGITDGNYNDTQWRQDVLPFIIRGSYQKNLKSVFEKIQDEARLNPSITPEMIEDRMDKAQLYLGKIYEDFSITIANTTDYLEVPLKITDDGKKLTPTDGIEKPLTEEELKKFNSVKQHTLISQKELKSMKAVYQTKAAKPVEDDYVLQFYQSFSGAVGPEDQRKIDYKPEPLQNSSALNQRAFLASAAMLKKHLELTLATKNVETKEAMLKRNTLMLNDLVRGYGLDGDQVEAIMNPANKVSDLPGLFHISDETIYGYQKVSQEDMPELTPMELRKNSFVYAVDNLLPSQETIQKTFYTAKDLLYKTGKIALETANVVVENVKGTVKDIASGNILSDFDDIGIDESDLGGLNQSPDERRIEYEEDEAARLKRLEEEQKQLEKERRAAEEKWQKLRDEQERAAKEQEQRTAALDSLEPWQQKIVGHQDRYANSWYNRMLISIGKSSGDSLENCIDTFANYMGNYMDPEVKSYSVYGKKLGKAWGKFDNISGQFFKQVVTGDIVKNIAKTQLRRFLLAPDAVHYVSGKQVAMECFAPSYLHGEMRPPIHFNEAYLAEFYNETGIYPDESSMIGQMMTETMKIEDNNYTDEQWRTSIMPQIIQGSYRTQLEALSNTIREEYLNNPAVSKELYEKRLEKAATALGKIYEDFSTTLANHTEYLNAPMKLFDGKRPELTEAQLAVLTPEQVKKYNRQKTPSISSKAEVGRILTAAKQADRKPKDISATFEQFLKCCSGYDAAGKERLFKSPAAYNDSNREPGQDRAFISGVITAREVINTAGQRGFFSKLFHKEAAKNEALMCEAVRNTLKNTFGMDDKLANMLLDPKTNVMNTFKTLGFSDENILGYKKMEVPDPKLMAQKQKTMSDHYNDWAPTIKQYATKAVGVAKGIVSGGYKLAKAGTQLAVKGIKGLYNYYFGGNVNDPSLVEEDPKPEELNNENQPEEQKVEEQPEEKQPEEEVYEEANDHFEEEPEQKKEEQQPVQKNEEIDDDEFEELEEDPEEQQEELNNEKQPEEQKNEEIDDDEFEELEEDTEEQQEELNNEKQPEEKEEPEKQPEEKKVDEQPVQKNEEIDDDEFEELEEDPEEQQEELNNEKQPEEKEEPEKQPEEKIDLDELQELKEDPDEEPRLNEEEIQKSDQQAEKELDNLVDGIQEEKESWFSARYWTGGWIGGKTKEQMMDEISNTQSQIISNIKQTDWKDKEKITLELGKLQYTESVKHYLDKDRLTIKQVEAALTPNVMDPRSQKFAESSLFKEVCNPLFKACHSAEELCNIPELPKSLNTLTVNTSKAINRAKVREEKKNLQVEQNQKKPDEENSIIPS